MNQTKMMLELFAVMVVMTSAAAGAAYSTTALPDDGGMPHLAAAVSADGGMVREVVRDLSLASRELGDGGY